MRLLAPAKINLHLRVGDTRQDGYHPLLTWMCTIGLFDTLKLELRPQGSGADLMTLECDDPAMPCDVRNLVVRAGYGLAEALGQRGRNASVAPVNAVLQKRIPAGGGLGGGSSDAARGLMGLNRLWAAGCNTEELAEVSQQYGSDLSFFFHGPSSICTGRGERVAPTPPPQPGWVMLILPGIAMPTPLVYRRFNQLRLGSAAAVERPPDRRTWAKLGAEALLPHLVNDLEAAAFSINARLGQIQEEAQDLLGRPVRMSGSGSSLFTLYDRRPAAEAAAASALRCFGQRTRTLAAPMAPAIDDDLAAETAARA